MKVAVRYYTRGGNTKKLADAIADAVGEQAKPISEGLAENVDILFLGSSVYAFSVDRKVEEFIKGINVNVGRVVNFSTAALVKSTYKQISKLLSDKNIPFENEEFCCKGSFAMMNIGRPNEDDCKNAALFARKIISQGEKK